MFKLLDISEIKIPLIQFIDQQKGTKKVTWAIYRPDEKKLKKYWKVGIELSINRNTINPAKFTDQQKKASKVANSSKWSFY